MLTSLDDRDLARVGVAGGVRRQVMRLARLATRAGADGLVCSPQEARSLRRALGLGCVLVTPGVRPSGSALGDQKRAADPRSAVAAGADWLVIGRPIREADDPVALVDAIARDMRAGRRQRG